MRWGILGAANIAKKAIIPALQRTEEAQVYAAASLSGKEKVFAEEFNIPKTYDTYEGLLSDPEIEAVYIPLPNHLHKEWTIKAAQAGKHVLCEKPAALTTGDGQEMIQACEQQGVLFLEAFMYQFHPQHEKVKELIKEGSIGDVRLVRTSFSFNFDRSGYNIRLDSEKGGGAFWDVGCYGVHSALHIMEEEVKSVTAVANIDDESGVDLTTGASLLLENGVVVQVDCSFESEGRNEYQVIGSEGTLTVHDAYRPDKQNHIGKITLRNQDKEQELIETGDQYRIQVERFMDAVQKGVSFEKYHKETLRYLQVMEDISKLINQ
ncbi:Gfo/Idh/MocA family protein [Halobacillus sp. Marseille-Q1614]|uniref:Gfo/Idh/MocA family protein n=1 Tax=Halobacillus sp. Marseille-Q1614 TaxID=2709134 RepID=UPI00156DF2BB|nr:Gfo/Idh/MocA family oxidoreductase [Halobacillus sp. Marseille-Q1614]